MIDPKLFIRSLNKYTNFITGVPDSLLKNLLSEIDGNFRGKHIISTNEGSSIGLAIGSYLSSRKPSVVYMQNAGLGNAINPLISLADKNVYSIPMVLIIGWRGEVLSNTKQIKDEPQHISQGKNTINLILQKVLDTKLNYELKKEIIIVDDFSNDGTREILKGLDLSSNENIKILFHDINTGKGSAIQTGLKAVTGEFTIIQDADLEYDPNDYNKLLQPIINNGADVVYGSRFVGAGSTRVLFFWHRIANGILTLLSNMKSNLNLTDMECGYKIFKTSAITSIQLKEKS